MAENLIEIKLTGESISPGQVRSKEIAELIESVEEMMASVIVKDHPEIKKEDVIVGLADISEGSMKLSFSSSMQAFVLSAFLVLGQAVTNNEFENLPSNAVKSLQTISSFSRRHNCIAEMRSPQKEGIIANITPDMDIKISPPIMGETTIYGRILRVGGKKPRAMVETTDGQLIYCDLSIELAKNLGHRLYALVALSGKAEWDSHDFELEKFHIEAIEPYEEKSISSTLADLSELMGKHYDGITGAFLKQ